MVRHVPGPDHNNNSNKQKENKSFISKMFKSAIKALTVAVSTGSKNPILGSILGVLTLLYEIWDNWLNPKKDED